MKFFAASKHTMLVNIMSRLYYYFGLCFISERKVGGNWFMWTLYHVSYHVH